MIGGWGVGGEVGDSGEPLVLRRPGLRRKRNYGQCISAYLSEGVPFTSLTERSCPVPVPVYIPVPFPVLVPVSVPILLPQGRQSSPSPSWRLSTHVSFYISEKLFADFGRPQRM